VGSVSHLLTVWISGQVRRVTKPTRREMKRRAAVEPVIGHTKAEHRMGRNDLKAREGDRINTALAAAGYNFALLLRWLARYLRALLQALSTTFPSATSPQNRPSIVLDGRRYGSRATARPAAFPHFEKHCGLRASSGFCEALRTSRIVRPPSHAPTSAR